MARSVRDMLECARMFDALRVAGIESIEDREQLRRISMTLQRWYELECGDDNGYMSFCIVRGRMAREVLAGGSVKRTFEYAEDAASDGEPYLERHYHNSIDPKPSYVRIPDRETGAKKRLAKIMAKYPQLQAYIQTDPRGCALYILRPGDIPEGSDASSCYTRGIAVHR